MNREELTVDRKFIVKLREKEFVMLGGLLDLAHRIGLRCIETEILEKFSQPEKDYWVVQALVRFRAENGEDALWSAVGDASPQSSQMRGAYLRHAETRAIARALRWATNVSMAAVEELGPDTEPSNGHHAPEPKPAPVQRAKHDPADHAERQAAAEPKICEECGVEVPAEVAEASVKRFRRVLCIPDGKAEQARLKEVAATASA